MTAGPGGRLPGTAPQPGPAPQPPPALQQFLQSRPAPRPGERCEMCTEPIGDGHSHVVDLNSRNLICTCRACFLLFTTEGAAGGRYRAVPDRYRYLPRFAITGAQWEELQIPVGMAFFFRNSDLDRFVAFYPSPGGATESLLPLDTWQQVLAANPAAADLADDVEALLLRRRDIKQEVPAGDTAAESNSSSRTGEANSAEAYLVPIDACYELVGRVRMNWRGFHGGAEVWQEIGGFFGRLRERSGEAADE